MNLTKYGYKSGMRQWLEMLSHTSRTGVKLCGLAPCMRSLHDVIIGFPLGPLISPHSPITCEVVKLCVPCDGAPSRVIPCFAYIVSRTPGTLHRLGCNSSSVLLFYKGNAYSLARLQESKPTSKRCLSQS